MSKLVQEAYQYAAQDDEQEDEMEHVTIPRFEVIDHTKNGEGRVLVRYNVKTQMSLQDGGNTCKLFVTDAEQPKKEREYHA